ncbi:MAG: AraC family transcriptional regulator [Hyphomicrobiales bacterium]|nr:MAG: AraC family transcriptional regulator [Hyphomicrobiales bacterium]
MIETVNGYTYTPLVAVEAARRVLSGERSEGFDYFAAAPLPPGRELLPGLTEMTLPAGSYARFSHAGHISGIRGTCGAVFEAGIPALGREPDTRWFSFVEYYGPDFEPSTGLGTVEIWVKLKL